MRSPAGVYRQRRRLAEAITDPLGRVYRDLCEQPELYERPELVAGIRSPDARARRDAMARAYLPGTHTMRATARPYGLQHSTVGRAVGRYQRDGGGEEATGECKV